LAEIVRCKQTPRGKQGAKANDDKRERQREEEISRKRAADAQKINDGINGPHRWISLLSFSIKKSNSRRCGSGIVCV
jgi:hypothetical protein